HPHVATRRIVLDGVRHKVRDDLREALGIADAVHRRQVRADGHLPIMCEWLQKLDAFLADKREVEGDALDRAFAGIESGKLQERFDEPAHPLTGALARLKRVAVL